MMATTDVQASRMPEVAPTSRRSTSQHQNDSRIVRRFSRKASDECQDTGFTPRSYIPLLEKRHSKAELGAKRVANVNPAQLTRRASESCLPPIRAPPPVRHMSSDIPGDTSSPTSTSLSSPLGGGGGSSWGVGDKDSAGTSAPHSLQLPTATNNHLVGDNGETRSGTHHVRKDASMSNLSAVDTLDTHRHSAGVVTPDQIRLKPDQRLAQDNDGAHEPAAHTNKHQGSSGGGGGSGAQSTSKPTAVSKQHKTGRGRVMSMQSLPKLTPGDEPFSIRRKIEQFRKWHEEQYSEKLKKLKVDADKEKGDVQGKPSHKTTSPSRDAKNSHAFSSMDIDFAKILEENIKNSNHTAPVAKKDSVAKSGRRRSDARDLVAVPTLKAPVDNDRKTRIPRCKSGATWRTWRDVNDSDAYNDVSKYIEENELLPPERMTWICSWLGDVEKALGRGDPEGQGDGQVKAGDGEVDRNEESIILSERFSVLH